MNNQDEMFEAATETPASLGVSAEAEGRAAEQPLGQCPAHMPGELPSQRKHTMDFGRFHVTRAAIPGTTILTFRRKREHLPEFATVVPGRIIVAKITRKDVGAEKPDHRFTVKSYEAGEKPRVLFAGNSWVCMSKTEKIVYKMVKCDIKETQRRHITRKRKHAAAKEKGGEARCYVSTR